MIHRLGITLLVCLLSVCLYAQELVVLRGKVVNNENQKGIPKVTITVYQGTREEKLGAIGEVLTDEEGGFQLEIPKVEKVYITIPDSLLCLDPGTFYLTDGSFQFVRFDCLKRTSENKEQTIQVLKEESNKQEQVLDNITIVTPKGGFERDLSSVNLSDITPAVATSNRLETGLTTLAGVNSNNELSSQYNVRGGSFDENLIYVNGVEMYRPVLVRSGKQEGLSFINPTMVEDISFSAGGFKARYGDKLSSVLDITYRKPIENKAYLQASFLGAGATVDLVSKDKALTAVMGMRYHNNRLLMNRSDDDGYYKPVFMDAQTSVNYKLDEQWSFSFLGNMTGNHYKYEPNRANVSFGAYNSVSNVTVLYDGREEDKYSSLFGAFTSSYVWKDDNKIEAVFSAYHTQEKEYYDIEASYLLVDQAEYDADPLFGKDIERPAPVKKGIASQFLHARNNYDALALSAELKGKALFRDSDASLHWGVKYTKENIKDRLSEWELMDSLGYVLPAIHPYAALQTQHTVDINRFMAYGEWNKALYTTDAKITLNAGARMQWWKMSESDKSKVVVSPRAQIAFEPSNWDKEMLFSLALGLYQQPPSYREYRGFDGELNPDLKAQKAWVFVLGHQYRFKMWGRNFGLHSEAYYKNIQDANIYTLDNVRMRYVANNEAKAYVYGADMRLYGEFIEGTESWVSVGFMKAEENYQNKGYIARPTDQRLKFGLLFQDYVPSIPNLRLYLNAVYSTGLPGGSPAYVDPYLYQGRLRDYKRADLGFNYVFKDKNIGQNRSWLQGIDQLQVGVEVYNVFDFDNAITNTWMRDISSNKEYAIPNYMTQRTLNIKVALTF
ncbi:TonB-dependent receptor plug domain-containing protein [Myroides fluvii]|uniref:TonB-dependent receptor plug domain-containing protein n=1 Tax=Myroides fluvii TaxID=2572594 RepID=UPI00131E05C7|nr:TonB-dependent receptor plug domain-containing protein [Myroides fluvii]